MVIMTICIILYIIVLIWAACGYNRCIKRTDLFFKKINVRDEIVDIFFEGPLIWIILLFSWLADLIESVTNILDKFIKFVKGE